MKKMHITIGRTTDFDDFLRDQIDSTEGVVWPVPKKANPGDEVLFLIPSQHGSLVAVGMVLTKPEKSEFWERKYAAEIGDVKKLKKPISIETLQQQFPDWGYPTYARGVTTVPEELIETLKKMVAKAK
jgi:hypothetical protein